MISRSQMNRQLYMGGGITQLPMNQIMVPRGEYGLGSIVKSVGKAVKGVAKGIGDIAKSDIGKAALLAAGTYYLGGGTFGGLRAGAPGFSFANLPGASLFTGAKDAITGSTLFQKAGEAITGKGLGIGATILGGSALMSSLFGSPTDAAEAYSRNPSAVKSYVAQYYKNLNKNASDEEAAQFAEEQTREYSMSDTFATGGRVGFSDGGNDDLEYKGWKKIFLKSNDAAESHPRHSEFIKRFAEETMGQDRSPKVTIKKAYGGPIGEPRENKGGIMELDYRKEGGFVPVGIKEKADDVPAMLSKNEFVFTADAVRGAGEGSVDKGAERLYNIMKTLENGGIV
jgi:hypothetical protein